VTHDWDKPEDVSFWLSYHMSEMAGRRGADIFDAMQRRVLMEIATHFERLLGTREYWGEEDWVRAHRDHYALLIERLQE
jgi:hypothetical protein